MVGYVYRHFCESKMSQLYAILPDQQIPYHDKKLHEVVLRWLDENQPYGLILSGDFIDLISFVEGKYDWNPRMVRDPVQAVDDHRLEAISVMRDYAHYAGYPKVKYFIDGNHENRLLKYMVRHAKLLSAVTDSSGRKLNSIERYLELDEGVWVYPVSKKAKAAYPQTHVTLGKHLAVYHGWIARQKSGQSAMATLEHLGHSVIVGHTHRQAKVYLTRHAISGPPAILTGIEAGTLADINGGLGYAIKPNWQQGFATVRVFDDGTFDAQLATYVNNTLYWEGQRYERSRKGILVRA